MIRLTKLSDYAVVVLSLLARERGGVMTATVLANQTGIPEPTVAKVLKLLARQDIVVSTRGVNGGYAMEKEPHNVTVADLIIALEGPIALTACVDSQTDDCTLSELCPLRGGWQKVNVAIKTALSSVTLADLLNGGQGYDRA
jgi:FeS assembly SUF system regulator